VTEITALLEAGCTYVITEGRDSGTVGIYDSSGQVRREIIDDMLRAVDPTRLIFEAPNPSGRSFFINRIGPNVNFGNISPYDLLTVEAERRALRYDTFNLPLK
jgi:phosphosulfolactate synthase